MLSKIDQATVNLIARNGKEVILKSVSEGVYDPETSQITNTSSSTPITAYSTRPSYSETQSPNLIGKKLAVYLVAGKNLSVVPSVGDLIVDGSDTYKVEMISKVEHRNIVALWRLICC